MNACGEPTVQFIACFFAAFVVAFVKMWLLTLALISVVPCIIIAGALMTRFETKYKIEQLHWSAYWLRGLWTRICCA